MWLKGRFLRLASDSNFLAPIAGEMVKTKNSCILYMFGDRSTMMPPGLTHFFFGKW